MAESSETHEHEPRAQLTLSSDAPEKTHALGRALGEHLRPGDVVGLFGDLGAGKTLFTQGVAEGMGADPRFRVASPTFTLINEHPGPVRLIHADLYRLDDLDEMFEIGLLDALGGEGACLVEWFERLEDEVPRERLELTLEALGDNQRRLTARAFGQRHEALLAAWGQSVRPNEDRA